MHGTPGPSVATLQCMRLRHACGVQGKERPEWVRKKLSEGMKGRSLGELSSRRGGILRGEAALWPGQAPYIQFHTACKCAALLLAVRSVRMH
jgi:hypothetical protein